MNLPTASAVGFAVSAGQPTDARDWVVVDFDGHLSPNKRGYLVTTEPTERSPLGYEMAAQVREIIVSDLRRQQHVPVDIALARAFARANGFVFGELTTGTNASFDRRIFIGATAVVIDDHTMTIAHVPPGQLVMIEDGLVYSVPELESWLPTFTGSGSSPLGPPDPLGYSSQIRPHLAVTELRPGDVLALIDSVCGEVFARQIFESGSHSSEMSGLYGHDPELVLDVFRTVVIDNELEEASIAVLALPPLPGSLQIQSMADVGRRARDEWHHTKAFVREWSPSFGSRKSSNPFSSHVEIPRSGGALKPMIEIPEYSISSTSSPEIANALPPTLTDGLRVKPDLAKAERRVGFQERMLRLTERGTPKWGSTWRKPTEASEFGVPGAHGVQIFRGASSLMGESSWRNYLPRMPLLQAGLLWIFIVCVIAGGVIGGAFLVDRRNDGDKDFGATISHIDQQIVNAISITDPAARDAALDQAEVLIANARTAGAPADELRQREMKVSSEKDVLEGILRMSEVQRIGSFNDDIKSDHWQIVQTSIGTFIVGGSLYQFHPETKVLEEILLQDQVIDSAPVQSLFGIAADSNGIYVTDGRHLFVRDLAGEWTATELKELSTFGAWGVGPVDAFNGSVYLLQKDYLNIYKFLSNPENGVANGEAWVNEGARDQLDTAIDIAIDGNIYVLLQNGTIRRYRSSELQEAKSPSYINGDVPVALLNGPASGYLYILVKSADGTSGHVVAFDPVGGTTYQLELPVGFETDGDVLAPFENPQDIAVDESTGTMYVVSGDGIWSMRYTLPLLDRMIQPDATPQADS